MSKYTTNIQLNHTTNRQELLDQLKSLKPLLPSPSSNPSQYYKINKQIEELRKLIIKLDSPFNKQ